MPSTRRSSSSRSRHLTTTTRPSVISDDQIIDLISKLQQLVPEAHSTSRCSRGKGSTSKVLQETCNYIKELNKQVDDLSGKLSELLASIDSDSDQAAIIRSLLM